MTSENQATNVTDKLLLSMLMDSTVEFMMSYYYLTLTFFRNTFAVKITQIQILN